MALDKRISAAASLLGRLGAKAGASKAGKASSARLSPKERRERARLAAAARWTKGKKRR